jgi:hypothetical protein
MSQYLLKIFLPLDCLAFVGAYQSAPENTYHRYVRLYLNKPTTPIPRDPHLDEACTTSGPHGTRLNNMRGLMGHPVFNPCEGDSCHIFPKPSWYLQNRLLTSFRKIHQLPIHVDLPPTKQTQLKLQWKSWMDSPLQWKSMDSPLV